MVPFLPLSASLDAMKKRKGILLRCLREGFGFGLGFCRLLYNNDIYQIIRGKALRFRKQSFSFARLVVQCFFYLLALRLQSGAPLLQLIDRVCRWIAEFLNECARRRGTSEAETNSRSKPNTANQERATWAISVLHDSKAQERRKRNIRTEYNLQ